MTGHVDSDALRSLVERLSTLTRESGSDDERRAAELIAAELIAAGAERVRLEDERVHGTYWWPVGLPTAAAAAAGALGRRGLAVFAGALGAFSVAGDIRFGPRPLRRVLPQRTTVNVVGEIGPADAPRTVVLVSHHDAAHTGLIFSPTPVRVLTERFPAAIERTDTGPPLMWGAVGGRCSWRSARCCAGLSCAASARCSARGTQRRWPTSAPAASCRAPTTTPPAARRW